MNLNGLAMLHVDGLVDHDRLPPHNNRAMLHHYGLRLVDHVLGFCREFSACDDSSGNSAASCDLAGEFHVSKKQGWLIGGSLPSMHLPSLSLAGYSAMCLTSNCDVAHRP